MKVGLVKVALFLVFFSLIAKTALIPLNQGVWWDEAVYLGLGRSLSHGFYAMMPNTTIESFRPPLLSILITPVHWSPIFARILVSAVSAISVAAVFVFSRKLYGKEAAIWASLLVSTNTLFMLFTTKVLSEALGMALLPISLLFFLNWERSKNIKHIALSGLFIGFCFITRYLLGAAAIAIISVLLYKLYKEKRISNACSLFAFLGAMALGCMPYIFLSYANFGSAFQPVIENLGIYTQPPVIQTLLVDMVQNYGLLLVLMSAGLALSYRRGIGLTETAMSIMVAIYLLLYFIGFKNEPRYLLTFAPIYACFAGYAIDVLSKRNFNAWKLLPLIVVLASLAYALVGLNSIYADRFAASSLVQASNDISSMTSPGEAILSVSYPYVIYFSERQALASWDSEETIRTARENNIRYVLLYRFEETNPVFYGNYFDESDEFKKIKTYPQWGHPEATTIFQYVG